MAKKKFTVRVPASTSNLGPGFDGLGMALALWNEVEVEQSAGKNEIIVELSGEGASTLTQGSDNLIVKSAMTVLAGRETGRLVLRCVNRIPLARGLGSSAAAAISGLLIGNELIENKLSARELLEYATTLEKHPDNVAAALNPKGGLVASVRRHKEFETYPLALHADLAAVVCVPRFELETKKSRAALPKTVLLEQAVDNVGRVAVLTQALSEGRWERLSLAMEDFLHQPYRLSLVPGMAAVIAAANAVEGVGACLSGSGPSILALGRKGAGLAAAGKAMVAAFKAAGVSSEAHALAVARQGARVEK